jgi:hypothetical protein
MGHSYRDICLTFVYDRLDLLRQTFGSLSAHIIC